MENPPEWFQALCWEMWCMYNGSQGGSQQQQQPLPQSQLQSSVFSQTINNNNNNSATLPQLGPTSLLNNSSLAASLRNLTPPSALENHLQSNSSKPSHHSDIFTSTGDGAPSPFTASGTISSSQNQTSALSQNHVSNADFGNLSHNSSTSPTSSLLLGNTDTPPVTGSLFPPESNFFNQVTGTENSMNTPVTSMGSEASLPFQNSIYDSSLFNPDIPVFANEPASVAPDHQHSLEKLPMPLSPSSGSTYQLKNEESLSSSPSASSASSSSVLPDIKDLPDQDSLKSCEEKTPRKKPYREPFVILKIDSHNTINYRDVIRVDSTSSADKSMMQTPFDLFVNIDKRHSRQPGKKPLTIEFSGEFPACKGVLKHHGTPVWGFEVRVRPEWNFTRHKNQLIWVWAQPQCLTPTQTPMPQSSSQALSSFPMQRDCFSSQALRPTVGVKRERSTDMDLPQAKHPRLLCKRPSVIVIVRRRIRPGMHTQFAELFKQLKQLVQKASGCKMAKRWEDLSKMEFALKTEWDNYQSWIKWFTQPQRREIVRKMKEYLAEEPKIDYYKEESYHQCQ